MKLRKTDKGTLFVDVCDERGEHGGRDLVVTQIVDHENGSQTVEFLQLNPLGNFIQFNSKELEQKGIVRKYPDQHWDAEFP